MRPAKIVETTVRVDATVTVEYPDGMIVRMPRVWFGQGGTVEDAAVTAGRHLDAQFREEIARVMEILEGGTNADGESLWLVEGSPWVHEDFAGAVVDADGCLWVWMDNWPGNQWLSPTGHGAKDWEGLAFPVKLAPQAWMKGLGQ